MAKDWTRHATAKEVARVAQIDARRLRFRSAAKACSSERDEIVNRVSNRGRYRDQRDAKRSEGIRSINERIAAREATNAG